MQVFDLQNCFNVYGLLSSQIVLYYSPVGGVVTFHLRKWDP